MKLTAVTATNLKGLNFSHALGPVNIVTGNSNFIGKSAVLEAIRIGLAGHLPRLGKQPSSTMMLAGQHRPEMEVILNFDDNSVVRRGWKRKASGGAEVTANDVPPILQIPTVLLDIKDYFSRTTADRIKFVFDKIDLSQHGFDDATIQARLMKIETLPATISSQAVKDVIQQMALSIERRQTARLTVQKWIEDLTDFLKTEQKAYAITAKSHNSTLALLRKDMPTIPPKDVSAEFEAKQKELATVVLQLTTIKTQLESWHTAQSRKKEFEAVLGNPILEPTVARQEAKAAEEYLSSLQDKQIALEKNLTKLRERRKGLIAAKAKVDASIEIAQKSFDAVGNMTCCPTCKSEGEGWKSKWLEEIKQEIAQIQKQFSADDLQKVETEGRASRAESDALTLQIENEKARIQNMRTILSMHEQAWQRYQTAVKESQAIDQAVDRPDAQAIAKLEVEESTLQVIVGQLRVQHEQWTAYRASIAKRDEAEGLAVRAQTFAEVYKQAAATLLAIQEELVQVAFGGILERARALTDGILLAPLEYRDGDLGMTLPTGFVSWQTMSGTEEALAFAAFSVALAQESPIKIVMIDELDRLERSKRQQLVDRMLELTSKGVVDQFVGVSLEAGFDPAKVNIIKVEA